MFSNDFTEILTAVKKRSSMKQWALAVMILFLCVPLGWAQTGKVKNVIVMVPDGCSSTIQTLARWYKGEPLALDDLVVGSVSTYMSNSVITGSAAAATAFATGYKTTVRFLGVGPRADDLLSTIGPVPQDMPYKPLATVLEGARLMKKATGLVATSRITHATPAAFACHIHDRGMDNEIMEHLVYQDIDVVFGGGKRHLVPLEQGGRRTDGEDLLQALMDRGYQFVETCDQMTKVQTGKVWGLFNDSHMAPDIDRAEFAPTEPSLAEMTGKAIDLLSQDPDGFFLMVEGSQVDWAGHANDGAYMVTDFIAFDDAVKTAVDFARADGNTLVLIYPDHDTGALSIGHDLADPGYTATTVEDLIDPLKGMTITSEGLAKKIGADTSAANIKAQLLQWWNIAATDNDVAEIMNEIAGGQSLGYAISHVIGKNYTVLGWTTHGHAGGDVPLWSYGPNSPAGLLDNTELATVVADAFGFSLEKVQGRLFVEASEAFLFYNLDMTDPENPVIKVGNTQFPCSKNVMIRKGKETVLEGLVVYAPETGKVYVPRQAVSLLNGGAVIDNILADPAPVDNFDLPPNCATYDFFSNTMHIPCFDNGQTLFWMDMNITSYQSPMKFEMGDWGYYQAN